MYRPDRSSPSLSGVRTEILIATYKRPEGLSRLLRSLEVELSASHSGTKVLVVDNDPERSARGVVDGFGAEFRYVAEARPGIAAARNRGLLSADQESDLFLFVDDDEEVQAGWLNHMVSAVYSVGADVVCGPVLPVLPDSCPWWVRAGGFFERPRQLTGSDVRWPATNNTALRRSVLAKLEGAFFSEDFSRTGGSDTEFFARVRQSGARFAWCDEAVVLEYQPADRATFRWLWARGTRLGNVSSRMLLRNAASRRKIRAIAVARMLAAVPLALAYLVLPGRRWGQALMNLPKGVGMHRALKGQLTEEYARNVVLGQ